jgi:hypothetical protein
MGIQKGLKIWVVSCPLHPAAVRYPDMVSEATEALRPLALAYHMANPD